MKSTSEAKWLSSSYNSFSCFFTKGIQSRALALKELGVRKRCPDHGGVLFAAFLVMTCLAFLLTQPRPHAQGKHCLLWAGTLKTSQQNYSVDSSIRKLLEVLSQFKFPPLHLLDPVSY